MFTILEIQRIDFIFGSSYKKVNTTPQEAHYIRKWVSLKSKIHFLECGVSDRLEVVSSLESHLRYDLELTEKISYTC